jgi:hypothetical protein
MCAHSVCAQPYQKAGNEAEIKREEGRILLYCRILFWNLHEKTDRNHETSILHEDGVSFCKTIRDHILEHSKYSVKTLFQYDFSGKI